MRRLLPFKGEEMGKAVICSESEMGRVLDQMRVQGWEKVSVQRRIDQLKIWDHLEWKRLTGAKEMV